MQQSFSEDRGRRDKGKGGRQAEEIEDRCARPEPSHEPQQSHAHACLLPECFHIQGKGTCMQAGKRVWHVACFSSPSSVCVTRWGKGLLCFSSFLLRSLSSAFQASCYTHASRLFLPPAPFSFLLFPMPLPFCSKTHIVSI